MFKKRLNNRRADSKLLSIWWFAVLVVIGVGIVIATLIFNSNKIDIRLIESDVLGDRVIDCITSFGYINEDFISGNLDLVEVCGLNKQILDQSGNFFIKISLLDSQNREIFPAKYYGNRVFEADCKIADKIAAKNYPRCIEKEIQVLDSNKNILILNVMAGSNQEYRTEEKK